MLHYTCGIRQYFDFHCYLTNIVVLPCCVVDVEFSSRARAASIEARRPTNGGNEGSPLLAMTSVDTEKSMSGEQRKMGILRGGMRSRDLAIEYFLAKCGKFA